MYSLIFLFTKTNSSDFIRAAGQTTASLSLIIPKVSGKEPFFRPNLRQGRQNHEDVVGAAAAAFG
jgi:hypothetical protein